MSSDSIPWSGRRETVATRPQFFEIHRLAAFSPRSLDIDVVLDLMIHDIDIVLSLVPAAVREVRAVGIPVLSQKADIANARVEFEDGCVANFTASRVSFEKTRKLTIFSAARLHFGRLCEPDRNDGFIANGTRD